MLLFLFTVVGAVLILEGVPYLAFPSKVKEWALSMQEASDGALRITGLISMAVGLAVIYAATLFFS